MSEMVGINTIFKDKNYIWLSQNNSLPVQRPAYDARFHNFIFNNERKLKKKTAPRL